MFYFDFTFIYQSGKICGDTMQKSFLEWSYAKFEVETLSQVHHFQCPACAPSMLAVAVDGKRKLYRFKSQPGCVKFFNTSILGCHRCNLFLSLSPILVLLDLMYFLMVCFWPKMLR